MRGINGCAAAAEHGFAWGFTAAATQSNRNPVGFLTRVTFLALEGPAVLVLSLHLY
jgi:hypothetical protein